MTDGTGRIFYGWYIVAVCFVVNFVVFGIAINTFTVYVKPIQADLGWSRGEISVGILLAGIAMGLGAALIGRLIDRTGARLPMAAGSRRRSRSPTSTRSSPSRASVREQPRSSQSPW